MNKINKILIFFVIFLLSFSSLILPSSAFFQKINSNEQNYSNNSNWYKYQNNNQNTGCSNSNAPDTDTILWTYSPIGYVFAESSPAVVDGKVYIGAGSMIATGNLYCLDEYDGGLIWAYQTDGWIMSSPAYSDGKIFFGSFYDGKVHCINAETGTFIWNYQTDNQIFSSPVIDENKVFVGSWNFNSEIGKMLCLDSSNGDKIWIYTPDKGVISSPAVYENKVYFGSMDGYVYCLYNSNGSLVWKNKIGNEIRSSPAIFNGNIYVGSDNGKIYCLDHTYGAKLWDFQTGGNIVSSPAIYDGKLYIGSYDKKLYCLNASTGFYLWNYSNGQKYYGSPTVSDEKVYVGTGIISPPTGMFNCIDAHNGDLIWSLSQDSGVYSSPAIANNKTYMNSKDGILYCFCDNIPPNQPERPSGKITGKPGEIYDYNTRCTDLNGDELRYGWDFNSDKTVDIWTDFFPSGENINISYSWQEKGIYFVRVKAEDAGGFQSKWSKPLVVTITKSKTIKNSFFTSRFPLFEKIIQFILTPLLIYR